MQYALINGVRNHPDAAYALQDVYSDYISDAVLAEELGFSSTWYGEHHFRECQWTGSPMMVAAAVAARTERIRIGTSVVLLPFHDPIRVAEDAAIADILSNGRFDLGVGPGSQYEEFVTFGKDPAEMNQRSWEMVDWIQRGVHRAGDVQPHRTVLRHRRHDLHHQAGAATAADVVGRHGAEEPRPRRGTRHEPDRAVQRRVRRRAGGVRTQPGGLPGVGDDPRLRRRHDRQGMGDRRARASSTSSTSTRCARTCRASRHPPMLASPRRCCAAATPDSGSPLSAHPTT